MIQENLDNINSMSFRLEDLHSTRCYAAIQVPPLAPYVNPSSTSEIFFAVHTISLQCYPIPLVLMKVPVIHIVFSYTFSKD